MAICRITDCSPAAVSRTLKAGRRPARRYENSIFSLIFRVWREDLRYVNVNGALNWSDSVGKFNGVTSFPRNLEGNGRPDCSLLSRNDSVEKVSTVWRT